MKKAIWVVVILVIIGIIVGMNRDKKVEPMVETGPIKIGVLLPLTGDAASYGEPGQKMYQIATEEINASGGINGRNLELIVEDSKCSGKDATNAAQKLINTDHVQVIIGGLCSSESLAVAPIAATAKVTLFSPGSSNPGLTGINEYFARDYPSDSSQGKILADIAFNDKNYKKVAFIQEQTDYASGVYKAFNDEFIRLGGTIVKEEFPTSNTDFRSALTKLKDTKPDVLFINTQTPASASRVLAQFQQLKWKVAIIINDAISGDPETISKNVTVLEGALTAQFGIDMTNQKFQDMIAKYKTKFGAEPPYQSYAQTEYDAVYILKDAIAAVGNDGTKVAAWLRTVKDWQGASGSVTIGSDGDRVGGHTPLMVKGGKVVAYTK